MEIVLSFIDPTDGETLEITVTRAEVTAAIAWHEARGYTLFEKGEQL